MIEITTIDQQREYIRQYQCLKNIFYDPDETNRRLSEVNYVHPTSRANAIRKSLNRKSETLNTREAEILQDFPDYGIDIGFYSNALIYAPPLTFKSVRDHTAIIKLIQLGYLQIVEGMDNQGRTHQIICKTFRPNV